MTASPNRVVIGTRGSPLALWQARHVAAALEKISPGLMIEERVIVTSGDRFAGGPLIELGGKSVWVKEIEEALLARDIDLAVHSLKDVPAVMAGGLVLAGFPARADARDALICESAAFLSALPAGARIGTTSLRRACQLKALRPDLIIVPLRGNVETRLRKIKEGVADAAVMAAAGLDRLALSGTIAERIDMLRMLPAIGQGVLALQARGDDARVLALCAQLNDAATATAVTAERALLLGLGAGCATPVAGHATVSGREVRIDALVGRPDGSELLRETAACPVADAGGLGQRVARALLTRGADRILADSLRGPANVSSRPQ